MIDQELIAGFRRSERAAQHEIYSRSVQRVYGLVLRITGDRDEALDVVQDAYVRAFTRADQFDGRSSIETWLCRIAINEALQHRRRSARGEQVASVNGRFPRTAGTTAPDRRMEVQEALSRLPEADRAILILRYHEGLDYAAIADLTGCPAGTVASRLNRARARVRELLQESEVNAEENGRRSHQTGKSEEGSEEAVPDGLALPPPRLAEP